MGRTQPHRDVFVFFALAYAFTWALHGIMLARGDTLASGHTLYRLGLAGPLLAAIASTWRFAGAVELPGLLTRGVQLRGATAACLVAVVLPPALYCAASVAVGDGLPSLSGPLGLFVTVLPAQAWVVVCEEPGWRGYAWPRLHQRLGFVGAGLLLGVLWAAWHLPMFLVRDSHQQGLLPDFFLTVIAWTFIMGALLARSSGSYLPALLFHASANSCAFVLVLTPRAEDLASAFWLATGALSVLFVVRVTPQREAWTDTPDTPSSQSS